MGKERCERHCDSGFSRSTLTGGHHDKLSKIGIVLLGKFVLVVDSYRGGFFLFLNFRFYAVGEYVDNVLLIGHADKIGNGTVDVWVRMLWVDEIVVSVGELVLNAFPNGLHICRAIVEDAHNTVRGHRGDKIFE